MKVHLFLCGLIVICSGYSLHEYNYLCFTRHGDYLQHPNDCQKFIRCSHGLAYEFQCPGNLWWHQEIKSCDYAYRTKCELNIGESSNDMDTMVTAENISKESSSENFSTSNIFELITEQNNVNNDNFKAELSTEQHPVLFTKLSSVNFTADYESELSATSDTINLKKQFIENITTDNVSELSTIEDSLSWANQTTKIFIIGNVTDNALELSREEPSTGLTEQFTDGAIAGSLPMLSTTEHTVSLTQQFIENVTIGNIPELSMKEYTVNLTESSFKSSTASSGYELSTEENTIQLTKQLLKDTTVNYHLELSTEENTIQITEQLFVDTTADYYLELSTEENTIELTEQLVGEVSSTIVTVNYVPELSTEKKKMQLKEQLLDDTALDYASELSTKENTFNLTEKLVDNFAEIEELLVTSTADEVSKLSEFSTAAATKTTKSIVKSIYKGNEAEISKGLADATISLITQTVQSTDKNQMTYVTETSKATSTDIVMENLKKPEDSQDNKTENIFDSPANQIISDLPTTNNKNDKKLFFKLNQLLTSTSMPTAYSQWPLGSTTQDPRLPFRAIECQGENNRQQFMALKCYQYYQCFAGWAFLLNCHEGWWFHTDMKRCIQDVDNECGY